MIFKDHYVLVFDLISKQDATENFHFPQFVGGPLRQELNFTNALENVTEHIVLGERMLLQLTSLVLLERTCKNEYICSPANNQPYPTTQLSVPWIFSL